MKKGLVVFVFIAILTIAYSLYTNYFEIKPSGTYSGKVVESSNCGRGFVTLKISGHPHKQFSIGGYNGTYLSDKKYFCKVIKIGDNLSIDFDKQKITIYRKEIELVWDLKSSSRVY